MTAAAALRWLVPVAAVAVLFPVALAGLVVGFTVVLAASRLSAAAWVELGRENRWLLVLVAWLALSMAWSPAPWGDRLSHWWRYLALAAVPVLARAVEPRLAAQAWRAFIAAAALLALLQLVGAARWIPVDGPLGSMFHYKGNKSIGIGALLALTAAGAVHLILQPQHTRGERWALAASAVLAVMALMLHSASRTSFVVLAALALLLCLLHLRDRRVWAGALALAVCAGLVVVAGEGGLALRKTAGQLDVSSQYRAQLYRETAQMVAERPLTGHGVGSWATRWAERNQVTELQEMNTAHQEWLQVAQQGGIGAAGLLLAVFVGWARAAWRAGLGAAGGLVALSLAAWTLQSLVNAAIRDASFAMPMILLLGLSLAAAQRSTTPQ